MREKKVVRQLDILAMSPKVSLDAWIESGYMCNTLE